MNDQHFDDLSRRLATGMSRRQFLNTLVGIALAGLLARIGYNSDSVAAQPMADPTVTPALNHRTYLPFVPSSSPCPPDRVCGALCCPAGQECINGVCAATCAGDPATWASIEVAQAALAAGADEVALTPGGCMRYRRVLSGGFVISETISVRGMPTLRFEHTAAQSTGWQDTDLDGFFEWQIAATRGATVDDDRVEITDFSPSTRLPTDRKTYTRTGDVIHVLIEQADGSGVLRPVASYDQDLWVETLAPRLALDGERISVSSPTAPCSATDCSDAVLQRKLQDAVDQGLQCLHGKKAYDLERRLTAHLFRSGIRLRCAAIPPHPSGEDVLAHTLTPLPFPLDLNPHALIEVNRNAFCDLTLARQLATLFHEFMHLENHDHDPNKEISSNREDVDQPYACARLCFGPPSDVTQCACATCLGTTKCDSRCDRSLGFQACSDDFGAWCPCPTRLRWYRTCAECLSGCPSGLACFGFHYCVPVNRGRCTPTTCP